MALNKDELLSFLREQDVAFEYDEHAAVFTTTEAAQLTRQLPGSACKNLFLRNKKKSAYFLLVAPAEKKTDISALSDLLGEGRLSFGSPADMGELLGVTPGSVTPLALLNDTDERVRFLMDADLHGASHIVVHPLVNTASLSLAVSSLVSVLNKKGHPVNVLDLQEARSD